MRNVPGCHQINSDLCVHSFSPGRWEKEVRWVWGEQPGCRRSQANGKPGACPAGSMPRSRAWMPTAGQMGFRGAQVLGESMPTNLGVSWIKLGWMKIGTEMTYKSYKELGQSRTCWKWWVRRWHPSRKGCVNFCQLERKSLHVQLRAETGLLITVSKSQFCWDGGWWINTNY